MRLIEKEELKTIQLNILDDVHNYCVTNGIRYFLAYGTLIGAIRHNGYIPWDDDIDIAMPRPDYDRFIQKYQSKKGFYHVVCHEKSPHYGLPFAKVHDTRTMMKESLYKNDCYGVYIDVFPVDAFVNEGQVIKAQVWRRLLNVKKANLNGGRSIVKRIIMFCMKFLLSNISIGYILDKIDEICRMGNYETADKVGYIPSLNSGHKDIIEKHLVSNYVLKPFEGKKFQTPIGYDAYLHQLYGDYMEIPSEKQRKSTHVFQAWWKN